MPGGTVQQHAGTGSHGRVQQGQPLAMGHGHRMSTSASGVEDPRSPQRRSSPEGTGQDAGAVSAWQCGKKDVACYETCASRWEILTNDPSV